MIIHLPVLQFQRSPFLTDTAEKMVRRNIVDTIPPLYCKVAIFTLLLLKVDNKCAEKGRVSYFYSQIRGTQKHDTRDLLMQIGLLDQEGFIIAIEYWLLLLIISMLSVSLSVVSSKKFRVSMMTNTQEKQSPLSIAANHISIRIS